jgi:serine phosphatase RsbU (regulator of sigma subunit)
MLSTAELKRRFSNLLKINEALTSETNFDSLLQLIVSQSSALLDAERATLYLLDEAHNELWSRIAQGSQEIRLPVGKGIAGYVAVSGEILNIPDAYLDLRFDRTNDRHNGFHTRNMLVVPMRDRQAKLIGVLQVINKQAEEGPFTADDEELLVALSSTAAIAIQNARLLEEVAEKERIQRDLEIAAQIQRSLLPRNMPEIEGLEMYAICRSSKEMSGDYYNVMDFGSKVGMMVADVCGKSVPAAFLMALAHNTVRMAMHKGQQPRDVLRQANHWLHAQMGDRYVAVSYLLFDMKRMRLTVSNAGQPTYPIIVRDGQCHTVEVSGIPLGLTDEVDYRQITRQLQSGDLVLMYTDGVVEAFNAEKELFGFERMHDLAAECSQLSAKEAVERIAGAVDAFAGGVDQSDDITIMALKIGG